MKAKTILRVLDICGWVLFLKPMAWILWKVEIILTEMPVLILLIICGGYIGLDILTKSKTESLPFWIYICVLHIALSVIWSLAKTTILEKIEYQNKKQKH